MSGIILTSNGSANQSAEEVKLPPGWRFFSAGRLHLQLPMKGETEVEFRDITPTVGYVSQPPHEGKWNLRVAITVKCPHCHEWFEAITPEYRLNAELDDLVRHVASGVVYFSQPRFCEECGIGYKMPKRDVERLRCMLGQWMAKDLIEAQVAGLPAYVPFRERLAAAQEHREPVAEWPEPFQLPLLSASEPELATASVA